MVQVRKKGRDLRRLRTSIVDLRRKYQGEKLTCAKKWADLRQKESAPCSDKQAIKASIKIVSIVIVIALKVSLN